MSTPALPSIVRTLVPVAVGQIAAYLGTLGLDLPDEVVSAVTVLLGFIVTTLYYLAIRFLEQKFPKAGIFLGWASVPGEYIPSSLRGKESHKTTEHELDTD